MNIKQTKVKNQMNFTGPLPKNILSPTTKQGQVKSKNKHSHYFENHFNPRINEQQMRGMIPNAYSQEGSNMFYPPQHQ